MLDVNTPVAQLLGAIVMPGAPAHGLGREDDEPAPYVIHLGIVLVD